MWIILTARYINFGHLHTNAITQKPENRVMQIRKIDQPDSLDYPKNTAD